MEEQSRKLGRRGAALGAFAAVLVAAGTGTAHAQSAPPPTPPGADTNFNSQQLDSLLAPIALYPDELLTPLLMATTYPVQVVAAARWLEDPTNRALTGDALANALARQDWDPSVKSLVPFPQVLTMLNGNLDWLQQLGYAVSVQQPEVFASVQRLRAQAQAAGQLKTTSQQVVSRQGTAIVITPAQPDVVYVPAYNPIVVYGAWAYPAYPPVYLPPPPGYGVGTAIATGIVFGTAVAVTAGLWGWARPNWGGSYVNVDVNRYNQINVNRMQINNNRWRSTSYAGRSGSPGFRAPTGPVGAPGGPMPPGPRPGSVPGNRPPLGGGGQPGQRPNFPNNGANRPGNPPPQRPNFPNGGGNRPIDPPGRPNLPHGLPSRPNLPATRPSMPATRPNFPANRPSLPANRPAAPVGRPNVPAINRPAQRPSPGPARPVGGGGGGGGRARPASGERD